MYSPLFLNLLLQRTTTPRISQTERNEKHKMKDVDQPFYVTDMAP